MTWLHIWTAQVWSPIVFETMVKTKKCESCECKVEESKFIVCGDCSNTKCNIEEHKQVTVINGLLTYVKTYLSRSPVLQLKLAVSSHFDEMDVQLAKDQLIRAVNGLDLDIGDSIKDRQNSANRSAKEAMLDDILHIFKAMDEFTDEPDLLPVFCATDLTKLPPASPETGGSLMSLFDIIARQETTIQNLVTSTTALQADVIALKSRPNRTYASTLGVTNEGRKDNTAVTITAKPTQRPSSSQSRDSPADQPPNSQNEKQLETDAEKFQVMSYNRNRQKKMQLKRGAAATSDILSAGPTKFMIQLTNVNPEMSEDDIKRYIESTGKDDRVQPEEVKDTSSPDYYTKRFLITFKTKDFDTVLSDSFWPDRIYYKQWYPARAGPRKQ